MNVDAHWRNTQKPVRFFMLDARVFLGVMLFLVHARLWTLILVILMMFVFWLLERRGLTFDAALRAFRCWILGTNRPAVHGDGKRNWVDFG